MDAKEKADMLRVFDAVEENGYATFPTTDGRMFLFKREFLERILANNKQEKIVIFCKNTSEAN